MNKAGGGEACGGDGNGGYHTAIGLKRALTEARPARQPFRRYMALVAAATRCKPFADHPLSTSLYDAPVSCTYATKRCAFAPAVPAQPAGAPAEARHRQLGGDCAFRRFAGVDNAAKGMLKPAYGYGISRSEEHTSELQSR